ncbi:MAG: hypothetical protein DSY80_06850 [Desulfocapsa sp.]|nr:MAG: hypothetical protein DSY80_06850 [Desulfocapsa sp.]
MRIGVVGPGALGCLFATKLFSAADKGDDSVTLIDHRPGRAVHLNQQGIILESTAGTETFSIPVLHDLISVPPVDVLFSCVKSYDLQDSLHSVQPLLIPETLYVFLQNGISHLQYNDADKLGATPVFATSSEGATALGPGHIRHAGSGHTCLGFPSKQTNKADDRLQCLLQRLQKCTLSCSITEDIHARIWAKLFINVGINGLTALKNCSNGELLDTSSTRNRIKILVREAKAVACAQGIAIFDDPIEATLAVCKNTASNISSMLQDIRKGRPTEIDAINGAVSRIAKEYGIPTPENDALIRNIKEITLAAEGDTEEK